MISARVIQRGYQKTTAKVAGMPMMVGHVGDKLGMLLMRAPKDDAKRAVV